MAFMVPYYSNDTFAEIENKYGETIYVPSKYVDLEDDEKVVAIHKNKWFCHLTAPGYMDQTEWSGPYETEDEAREAIRDIYNVDSATGEDLAD